MQFLYVSLMWWFLLLFRCCCCFVGRGVGLWFVVAVVVFRTLAINFVSVVLLLFGVFLFVAVFCFGGVLEVFVLVFDLSSICPVPTCLVELVWDELTCTWLSSRHITTVEASAGSRLSQAIHTCSQMVFSTFLLSSFSQLIRFTFICGPKCWLAGSPVSQPD